VNEEGKPLREASEGDAEGEAAEPYVARSVWLSSERLGITAKIDLVEVDGGAVVPFEYKRGAKPDNPEGAYLPELAQVCAQVLLLREHGYTCDYGEIYYAKDRKRVPIAIDDWLVARTLGAVERIRELVNEGVLPPPLEDSPKCNGCSLVGICLPDETRALAEAPEPPQPAEDPSLEVGDDPWGLAVGIERPVRRLFPARDDKLPVYVQAQGAMLRLDGERLIVQAKGENAKETRLSNTSHVALFGNVHVTTPVIRRLLDRGVPLLFFSYGGWFSGQAMGHDSKNVELRLAQYAASQDRQRCLALARGFVASKILNCRTLLRRNHANADPVALSELRQLARKARSADAIETLLGIEGTAARRYFGEFSGMLKGEVIGAFDLDGRNRRPPRDPVNALLSFCYSLLAHRRSPPGRAGRGSCRCPPADC
jgi:CRISPR-associated protein Cas1